MSAPFLQQMWHASGGEDSLLAGVTFSEEGQLPSAFRVTDFASSAIAAAGLAVSELVALADHGKVSPVIDRRLASFWFASSLRPVGWNLPSPWDPLAGDYEARNGWIRLHTNAPHHRAAAQRVLGSHGNPAAMAAAVKTWDAFALETAIIEQGGCAAQMRSLSEWQAHPQGRLIGDEPLVYLETSPDQRERKWNPLPGRPLAGLRVLDLTRVLAGPVATRFLAGFSADVLRIDPPDWNEAALEPEVTLGKNCARLDLADAGDRLIFERRLHEADILLHGYRADALEKLGYGAQARQALSPGLIDISLNAYGWSGPWRDRRGFDSLVQMSAGIAQAGMIWKKAEKPVPLPVQALDHATGYLMAAVAVRAVTRRLSSGLSTRARLSLARTAKLLADGGSQPEGLSLAAETPADQANAVEMTAWGEARRLLPPLTLSGVPMRWDLPATALGSAPPAWR